MKKLSLDDLRAAQEKLRCIVYGEPGSGKTWFGASAALDESTSPCLFVNFHSQIGGLLGNPRYQKALDAKDLVIVELSGYAELNYVYSYLKSGKGPLSKVMDEPPKTVVLDSVTELQRSEILRRAGEDPNAFKRDIGQPQIQDWGKLLAQFTQLAKLMYDLPYHVVFSFLERTELDRDGERVDVRGIAMQGQAKHQVPGYATLVMRLTKAPPNIGAFNVGRVYWGKDQTGAQIPDRLKDPTVPRLVKEVMSSE